MHANGIAFEVRRFLLQLLDSNVSILEVLIFEVRILKNYLFEVRI